MRNASRGTNPELYAQLAPDADRLATRVTIGRTILIAGLAAGLASVIYGIAARNACVLPPASDPNFSADSAAWDACNQGDMKRMESFSLVGVGLATAGLIGWVAVTPSRSELLDLVNRHNRVSPQPLQFQLGLTRFSTWRAPAPCSHSEMIQKPGLERGRSCKVLIE